MLVTSFTAVKNQDEEIKFEAYVNLQKRKSSFKVGEDIENSRRDFSDHFPMLLNGSEYFYWYQNSSAVQLSLKRLEQS